MTSIKDVARLAGVSVGTASNVLNRPGIVSPARRERVERAIAELGVRQPRRQLGGTATELLLAEVTGTTPDSRQVVFEPGLVVRASTGPAPRPDIDPGGIR